MQLPCSSRGLTPQSSPVQSTISHFHNYYSAAGLYHEAKAVPTYYGNGAENCQFLTETYMLPLKFLQSLQILKMRALDLFCLLEIVVYSVYGFYFWWQMRRGHEQQVDETAQRLGSDWAARIVRRYGCVVRVEGKENVPTHGAVIVMANHQSNYDIPILMGHMGRLLGFVAKKELFRIPGFSYWMKRMHCISLDRSDRAGAVKLFGELSRHIKESQSGIILFPEGTRTRDPDGAIQPFKEASLRLATIENVPILPVSIDGSRHFKRSDLLYRTRAGGRLVRMKIAPLVDSRAESSLERRALMASIRQTIESNCNAIRVEWPADTAQD